MRIAVIGLGVVGASVARALTLRGVDVTVFERAAALAGTSGTSFAWINSHNKNPRAYHNLNVAGMAEHVALAQSGGAQPSWLVRTGTLEWAEGAAEGGRLARSAAELTDRGYPVEWITEKQTRELVPDLSVVLNTMNEIRLGRVVNHGVAPSRGAG
jgi:glycine/D-amino acid oxidase-like deaminating enzyme